VRGCAVPWWVVAFSWGDTDNRPEVPIISGCGSRVASAAGRPDHPDSVGRRGTRLDCAPTLLLLEELDSPLAYLIDVGQGRFPRLSRVGLVAENVVKPRACTATISRSENRNPGPRAVGRSPS
jgi:hypothetical protein